MRSVTLKDVEQDKVVKTVAAHLKKFKMCERDRNILKWLEETDPESKDQINMPEVINEDCSDVEDVPVDHVIEADSQSDSEIEGNDLEQQQDIGEENGDSSPNRTSSSDDDTPLANKDGQWLYFTGCWMCLE